ncbi:hypothetical protein CO652_25810 [Rhizobium sp. H4]|nr:hypothetical protein CO652_25810 [Rhizobium sp. H4]
MKLYELMRAPGSYWRMLLVTLAFALVTYLRYESVTLTLYYSFVCIFLMQLGYIGGILFLAWRESHGRMAD